MSIGIVYHQKYYEKILLYLKNCQYVQKLIIDGYIICFFDVYTEAKITLYPLEFIEKYKHSALYMNLAYYPKSEVNNEAMMETLNICTRPLVNCFGYICRNIIEYDENKVIVNIL